MKAILSALLLVCSTLSVAAGDAIPRPPELQPDVDFWIRVYSEISTNQGFIHDQRNLAVVYETVNFAPDSTSRQRQAQVDAARKRFQEMLRHLAAGQPPRNAEEQRVRDLWGAASAPARLRQAVDDVRFQLGQSDRFRAGLQRSGTWEAHIAATLANRGLPPEIAALPHVESSFNPDAYSKVGAAGLWQFMRSTGRRFMRIDNAVDERMDPFRATEAAAQLLSYNYRVLGSWPLALTAYNHGAEGMRRARDRMGTTDIVKIVREYSSPLFGFASRNFYVSFLAALTIDQNPEKYFGSLQLQPELQFQEAELPTAASIATLERLVGVQRSTLRALNPALRDAVWSGARSVPAGYKLRLPHGGTAWTKELLAARLGAPPVVVAATPNAATSAVAAAVAASAEQQSYYVVRRGDALEAIARRTNIPLERLMALNSLRDQNFIYEGQRLRLSEAAVKAADAKASAPTLAASVAREATAELAEVTIESASRQPEPVSAAQAVAQSPTLVPGASSPVSADALDLSVAENNTIRVAAAETLGHYADWLQLPASRLRALNSLTSRTPVLLGRQLKLDFARVDRVSFEQRRRDYHQRLQAEYFSGNRIIGTEVYLARRGDSLWSVTQRNARLPIWLLQQYNPDVDFNELRPGVQIVLPRIEARPDV
jgi:membrane-bound lytic murein transglycosylase D